jgi:hypothetical protein
MAAAVVLALALVAWSSPSAEPPVTVAELAGVWAGTLTHAGETESFALEIHVYALEASTGKLLWKRDTRGAVVSTPAVVGDRVVVGNRAYDLLGLDAATGEPAWTRYIWFSWVDGPGDRPPGLALRRRAGADRRLRLPRLAGGGGGARVRDRPRRPGSRLHSLTCV